MPKRRVPSSFPLEGQNEQWSRKRLRLTAARKRTDLPYRSRSLFEHLSRDVRNIIYSFLSLSPQLQYLEDASARSGLAGTCHQAKEETDEEGAHQFAKFLHETLNKYVKDTGGKPWFPSQIKSLEDFGNLKELTICVDGSVAHFSTSDLVHSLSSLAIPEVTVHCFDVPPAVDKHPMEDIFQDSSLVFFRHRDAEIKPSRFTISYDIAGEGDFPIVERFRAMRVEDGPIETEKTRRARSRATNRVTQWHYLTYAIEESGQSGFLSYEADVEKRDPENLPSNLGYYFSSETIIEIEWQCELSEVSIAYDLDPEDF